MSGLPMPLTARQYAAILITKWEGFTPKPYVDGVAGNRVITVGYGTTIIDDQPVDRMMPDVSKAQAIGWMTAVIDDDLKALNRIIVAHNMKNDNPPHVMGALCSFAYNEGLTRVVASDVLAQVIAGNYEMAAVNMFNYVYTTRLPVRGLINRRMSEAYTLLSGNFNFTPDDDYKLMGPEVIAT